MHSDYIIIYFCCSVTAISFTALRYLETLDVLLLSCFFSPCVVIRSRKFFQYYFFLLASVLVPIFDEGICLLASEHTSQRVIDCIVTEALYCRMRDFRLPALTKSSRDFLCVRQLNRQ